MKPAKENIIIRRDREFAKDFTFKTAAGALRDISTWNFAAEIRETNCESGSLLATFAIVVDTATSTISLSLSNTETKAIPEGKAYWDLLVTIGTNDQTYIEGKVTVKCSVTEVV